MSNKISQTTRDEIYFLLRLGAHRSERFGTFGVSNKISRLELLRRYRANMDVRTEWGRIDRAELLRILDLMIEEEVTRRVSKEIDQFRKDMLSKEKNLKSEPAVKGAMSVQVAEGN